MPLLAHITDSCLVAACQRYTFAVWGWHINTGAVICLWCHDWQYFSTECWC